MSQTLKEWKQEVKAKFGSGHIQRENSFAARGAFNTRQVLGRVKSPRGAWYVVFSEKTNSQK